MRHVHIFIFSILLCIQGFAQNTISGVVSDKNSDEPLIGALRPGQVQPILRQHGWQVLADGSNVDWARQMGESGAGWALLFRCERLVVAQKS